MSNQIEMVCVNDLVPANHTYRSLHESIHYKKITHLLKSVEKNNNYKGYGSMRLFKCIRLQFMEDLSDRQLERFIAENNVAKWFCGFGLAEKTPTHTVFTRVRERIGTQKLAKIFSKIRDQLKANGLMNEIFTFVDASALIAKTNLWKERDEIKKKQKSMDNKNLRKVAHDKQAKIGCKGKNKYWYGYKKHVSVDMRSGLINKVAVTAANVLDMDGLKSVAPKQGAVYADKGYCAAKLDQQMAKRGCYLRAIKKNNMKEKNKDLDKWLTKIRSPYERVFSKQRKRVRYMGIAKNQFSEIMSAICFNAKRLMSLDPPNIALT